MMKKKDFRWVIAFLIIFMLTSCTKTNVMHAEDKKNNNLSQKNEVETIKDEADIDEGDVEIIDLDNYTTLQQFDVNYEELEDIRPETIPEIKLGFFIDRDRIINVNYPHYLVKEVSDGFICISIEKERDESFSYMKKVLQQSIIPSLNLPGGSILKSDEIAIFSDNKEVLLLPTIRKLNLSGEVVWEKQLKEDIQADRVNHLSVLEDDNFLFSVGGHSYSDNNYLIKCDKDGNMLWKRALNPLGFDRIDQVIITDKDDIVIIGLAYPRGSTPSHEWDILATKLDMKGNILDQKYRGGRDYEYVDEVKYNKNIGVVFIGRTSSIDGDFALTQKTESPFYFVACMDENLQIQWVWNEEKAGMIYNHILLSDDEICIMGSSLISNFITDNDYIKLSKKGEKIGNYSELSSQLWADGAQLLPNGHLVVGKRSIQFIDKESRNLDELIILDEKDKVMVRMNDIKYLPDQIISTDDGGFIVKSIRPVRVIPQPLYVSSIWYDQEVVLVKYNQDYEREWRKTYNKYKDIRIDFVQPLENGSVLTE